MNRRRYLPAFGIDVDARMPKSARQHGLEAEVATFEEGDPAGRRLDAVAAGQTWHWVEPAAGAAKAAQVLRADSPFSGQCQGMRTRGGGHDRRRCDARTGHTVAAQIRTLRFAHLRSRRSRWRSPSLRSRARTRRASALIRTGAPASPLLSRGTTVEGWPRDA